MSINIYAFCRKERISKHNTVTIYLRFTKNRRNRYISTGIKVPVTNWDFDEQRLISNDKQLQYQISEQIESYKKRIKRLEAMDIEPTLDNVIDNSHSVNCSLSEYFRKTIARLEKAGKIGTASKYKYALSLLHQFGMDSVRFGEIDIKYLQAFELALSEKGNKPNSIATKISVLKAVYNKALNEKIFVCKDNPFEKYKISKLWTPTRKRAILKEDIQRLMQASLPEQTTQYTELARDIFLFSYFSAGINFKDISTLCYSDILNGRIFYRRHKTGKEMNCQLMPLAQHILQKYQRINVSDNDYIFPILDTRKHITETQIANRLHKVLAHINRELKKWSKHIGLHTTLTTYVARHTYATVLKRAGVNIAIISESLGHSNISTTQIYLDSFENSQIDEAMRNLV